MAERVMERWRCRDCGYRAVDGGHPSITTCPQCRGDYTWELDRETDDGS